MSTSGSTTKSGKIMKAYSVLAAIVCVLFTAPFAAAAAEAKASDLSSECIPPTAEKALSECPGGPGKFDVNKKRAAAFKSAPPPREVKSRQDDLKPVNPEELKKYAQRDTRKNRLQARGQRGYPRKPHRAGLALPKRGDSRPRFVPKKKHSS